MWRADQLTELGLSADRLTLLVAQGRLVRRHRGVYGSALVAPTRRSHLVAALLAVGAESFLSRRTGLAMAGVRTLNVHRIEVTIAARHTPRHAGILVHRTTVAPADDEIQIVDGLRVASPELALVEVAGGESDAELDRLIAELCRRRRLRPARIDAVIQRRGGLPGIARLQAALARYRPPDHESVSAFEDDFAAWVAEDPELPPAQRNVRVGPWEFDFHWAAQGVVAETDGDQYHRTPTELERDRIKDAWCQARGIRVLRITQFRYAHDRPGIRADLLAMLGLRAVA